MERHIAHTVKNAGGQLHSGDKGSSAGGDPHRAAIFRAHPSSILGVKLNVSFSLNAAHYLITPFTQAQFHEAIDRAMEHFTARQVPKVALKLNGGGTRALDLDEILWIECGGHVKTLFLRDGGSEEVRISLSLLFSMLEELSPGQFVSPRKGYLVNQKAIRVVDSTSLTMHFGQSIPLARGTPGAGAVVTTRDGGAPFEPSATRHGSPQCQLFFHLRRPG